MFLHKSEDYADASDNYVAMLICRNFIEEVPNHNVSSANRATQYDTGGYQCEAATRDCNNNHVGMLVTHGVINAFICLGQTNAQGTFAVNTCTVGRQISRNTYSYAFFMQGICNDCIVENLYHWL